nr:cyanophycinase [uncultured Roseateles sp.]
MRQLLTTLLCCLFCLLGVGPLQAQADPYARGKGAAVAIGGALRYDNDAVWQRLIELAGGKGARFVVFASASGDPAKWGGRIVEVLKRHGAVAEALPVAPLLKGTDYKAAARDPALVAKVRAATGIYFAGGAQERITQALLDESGQPTPVLQAVWEVYRAGGVVAGSSAGAAIMSTQMFRDPPDVLNVLKQGLVEGKDMAPGLGFFGPGVFVDQHFLRRGRFGRMLPLMLAKGYTLGVGVDENSAVVLQGDTLEVIGHKGALLVDLVQASSDKQQADFNLRNARLSYLERGDRYQLASRQVLPSPAKLAESRIDPNAADFKPDNSDALYYPDILGDTAVSNLMSALIDNPQREVIGLAFGAPNSPRPELGFEFRFRKGPDSLGYYSGSNGIEDYTVINIYLDVQPVQFARPLYRR